MQLSIIIVSYNVKYFLEQCLYSVRRASEGLLVEVIIIDNASSDGSIEYLQLRFPEFVFLPQKENLGFAKACNLGWQQSRGENVLFLNPDTILAVDTLHRCLRFLQQNEQVGAVGVRMIDGSGTYLQESKRGVPGPLTALFKFIGLASLFPRSPFFARYYLGHLSEWEDNEVDVLAGAFMMIPNKVLQLVGAFDETFFMYGEDIDLSYRIQKKGYKNYYLAQTTIIHFKGESTRKTSLQYVRRFYGAMIIFVNKWHRGLGAALLRSVLQVAIYVSGGLSALRHAVLKKQELRLPVAPAPIPVTIVGTKAQFQQLAAVFSAPLLPQHVENITDINTATTQTLVLCEGPTTFGELISFIQQHPRAFRFRIHAAGSSSVVGSDSSDSSGEAMELSR